MADPASPQVRFRIPGIRERFVRLLDGEDVDGRATFVSVDPPAVAPDPVGDPGLSVPEV